MGEEVITDYSNKHPVARVKVDYFLEHAEEIIADTEHLYNPYAFMSLHLDDNEMARYYYRQLKEKHTDIWMSFGRSNTFMNPGETNRLKALDRVTREYCEATGHWDMFDWEDITDDTYIEEDFKDY